MAASILLSAIIVAGFAGLFFGIRWDRSRTDTFSIGSKSYAMTGVAQINDGDKKVFIPVYQEAK